MMSMNSITFLLLLAEYYVGILGASNHQQHFNSKEIDRVIDPAAAAARHLASFATIYEAEDPDNEIDGSSELYQSHVKMGGKNSYVVFNGISGGVRRGYCTLDFSYALGVNSTSSNCEISVDGESVRRIVEFRPTGGWGDFRNVLLHTTCPSGAFPIRVTALTDEGGPNLNYVKVTVGEEFTIGQVSGNPGTELGHCQGNCNGDSDCNFGLKCHLRYIPDDPGPPGCTGEIASSDTSNYCYDSSFDRTFTDVGLDTTKASKLGNCQGNCNSDGDCNTGLKCYNRQSNTDAGPPGCIGQMNGDWSYCYVPSETFNDVALDPVVKLSHCQGNCNTDNDCNTGFKCYDRHNDTDSGPPGCIGEMNGDWSYCYDPSYEGTFTMIDWNPTVKLGHCQGNCYGDTDCDNGLQCYDHDFKRVVPGCRGELNDYWDVCFDPLGHCEGNCDSDHDCSRGLKCYNRHSDNDSGPPGCIDRLNGDWSYCYDPWYEGTFTSIAQDPTVKLGHCQGNCDDDDDCDNGLQCYHRVGDDPGPPDCRGQMFTDFNYCYDPTAVGTIRTRIMDPEFTLGICEGDCDNDDHCDGDLKCWQRVFNGEPGPPGCRGDMYGGHRMVNLDYCYDPDKNVIPDIGKTKLHASRGWRLKTLPEFLVPLGGWKVSNIQLFASIDCAGASIMTDSSTPISSYEYFEGNIRYAFQEGSNFAWMSPPNGGSFPTDFYYIGILFSMPQEVGCITVTNAVESAAKEVTIQAYNSNTKHWEDILHQNNLDVSGHAVNTISLCRTSSPELLQDGVCDFLEENNSIGCNYDGGDCTTLNAICRGEDNLFLDKIGDRECHPRLNIEECSWDGFDCCDIVGDMSLLGNGVCNGGEYNTQKCGFDAGDCSDFNMRYPYCRDVIYPEKVGDGTCDGGPYDTEACMYDGGDCASGHPSPRPSASPTASARPSETPKSLPSPTILIAGSVVGIFGLAGILFWFCYARKKHQWAKNRKGKLRKDIEDGDGENLPFPVPIDPICRSASLLRGQFELKEDPTE